jgi:hypothetical protein
LHLAKQVTALSEAFIVLERGDGGPMYEGQLLAPDYFQRLISKEKLFATDDSRPGGGDPPDLKKIAILTKSVCVEIVQPKLDADFLELSSAP